MDKCVCVWGGGPCRQIQIHVLPDMDLDPYLDPDLDLSCPTSEYPGRPP